jgi:hypothetical protein
LWFHSCRCQKRRRRFDVYPSLTLLYYVPQMNYWVPHCWLCLHPLSSPQCLLCMPNGVWYLTFGEESGGGSYLASCFFIASWDCWFWIWQLIVLAWCPSILHLSCMLQVLSCIKVLIIRATIRGGEDRRVRGNP